MTDIQRIGLDEVARHFEEWEDPRSPVNRRHPLVSLVVIARMAVLAGADGPTAIAQGAALNGASRGEALDVPTGIPRQDVCRRVLVRLKPRAFQACFANGLPSLRATAAETTGVERPVFAVDGTTARRSPERGHGWGALHGVRAWASAFGLALGPVACAEKSNAITAIPELLRLVDIQGALITIDALGTRKAIAEQIIVSGADSVVALQGNQGTWHQAVIDHIDAQRATDVAEVKAQRPATEETGHGRDETRSSFQMPVPKDLPGRDQWSGLQSIGMVVSECLRAGKATVEDRSSMSSLGVNVKRFAHAVRSPGGIENSCHWSLDITYREDESRIRDRHMRENFAWLRRLTWSLLKHHPGRESGAMKRRSCGWSEGFMLEVLTGSIV